MVMFSSAPSASPPAPPTHRLRILRKTARSSQDGHPHLRPRPPVPSSSSSSSSSASSLHTQPPSCPNRSPLTFGDAVRAARNHVMPTGKHQGLRLRDVPYQYMTWLQLNRTKLARFPKLQRALEVIERHAMLGMRETPLATPRSTVLSLLTSPTTRNTPFLRAQSPPLDSDGSYTPSRVTDPTCTESSLSGQTSSEPRSWTSPAITSNSDSHVASRNASSGSRAAISIGSSRNSIGYGSTSSSSNAVVLSSPSDPNLPVVEDQSLNVEHSSPPISPGPCSASPDLYSGPTPLSIHRPVRNTSPDRGDQQSSPYEEFFTPTPIADDADVADADVESMTTRGHDAHMDSYLAGTGEPRCGMPLLLSNLDDRNGQNPLRAEQRGASPLAQRYVATARPGWRIPCTFSSTVASSSQTLAVLENSTASNRNSGQDIPSQGTSNLFKENHDANVLNPLPNLDFVKENVLSENILEEKGPKVMRQAQRSTTHPQAHAESITCLDTITGTPHCPTTSRTFNRSASASSRITSRPYTPEYFPTLETLRDANDSAIDLTKDDRPRLSRRRKRGAHRSPESSPSTSDSDDAPRQKHHRPRQRKRHRAHSPVYEPQLYLQQLFQQMSQDQDIKLRNACADSKEYMQGSLVETIRKQVAKDLSSLLAESLPSAQAHHDPTQLHAHIARAAQQLEDSLSKEFQSAHIATSTQYATRFSELERRIGEYNVDTGVTRAKSTEVGNRFDALGSAGDAVWMRVESIDKMLENVGMQKQFADLNEAVKSFSKPGDNRINMAEKKQYDLINKLDNIAASFCMTLHNIQSSAADQLHDLLKYTEQQASVTSIFASLPKTALEWKTRRQSSELIVMQDRAHLQTDSMPIFYEIYTSIPSKMHANPQTNKTFETLGQSSTELRSLVQLSEQQQCVYDLIDVAAQSQNRAVNRQLLLRADVERSKLAVTCDDDPDFGLILDDVYLRDVAFTSQNVLMPEIVTVAQRTAADVSILLDQQVNAEALFSSARQVKHPLALPQAQRHVHEIGSNGDDPTPIFHAILDGVYQLHSATQNCQSEHKVTCNLMYLGEQCIEGNSVLSYIPHRAGRSLDLCTLPSLPREGLVPSFGAILDEVHVSSNDTLQTEMVMNSLRCVDQSQQGHAVIASAQQHRHSAKLYSRRTQLIGTLDTSPLSFTALLRDIVQAGRLDHVARSVPALINNREYLCLQQEEAEHFIMSFKHIRINQLTSQVQSWRDRAKSGVAGAVNPFRNRFGIGILTEVDMATRACEDALTMLRQDSHLQRLEQRAMYLEDTGLLARSEAMRLHSALVRLRDQPANQISSHGVVSMIQGVLRGHHAEDIEEDSLVAAAEGGGEYLGRGVGEDDGFAIRFASRLRLGSLSASVTSSEADRLAQAQIDIEGLEVGVPSRMGSLSASVTSSVADRLSRSQIDAETGGLYEAREDATKEGEEISCGYEGNWVNGLTRSSGEFEEGDGHLEETV